MWNHHTIHLVLLCVNSKETRPDFLRECMSDAPGVPINEFSQRWCLRCGNRNCVRSDSNQMLFDIRAKTWHQKLFSNVPRAQDDDQSFAHIRAKNFVPTREPLEVRLDNLDKASPSILDNSEPKKVQPDNEKNDQDVKSVNIEPGGSFSFE